MLGFARAEVVGRYCEEGGGFGFGFCFHCCLYRGVFLWCLNRWMWVDFGLVVGDGIILWEKREVV